MQTELHRSTAKPFPAIASSLMEACLMELAEAGVVMLSTAEVEYVAAMHAAKEGIWLRCLTGEILTSKPELMTLYCDNQQHSSSCRMITITHTRSTSTSATTSFRMW